MSAIPTSQDVVNFLNERLERRGLPYRVDHVVVLPYVNPMWLANWEAPQLRDIEGDRDAVDEEIREARWVYPQVLE